MRFLMMAAFFIFVGLGFSRWFGVFAWYIPALMGLFSYWRCNTILMELGAEVPKSLYPSATYIDSTTEYYNSVWKVVILLGVVGAVLVTGMQFTSLTAKLEDTPNIGHVHKQVAELLAEEQVSVTPVVEKQLMDLKLPMYKILVTCAENNVKISYSLPAVKEGSTLVVLREGIYQPHESCETQQAGVTIGATLASDSAGGPTLSFTPSPEGYAFFKKVANERKLELWIKQIQEEFAKEGSSVAQVSSSQH